MKKFTLTLSLLLSTSAFAHTPNGTDSTVNGAKITGIEFYGPQFTIILNKTHAATACGHNDRLAADSATEPGKSYLPVLLEAWKSNKSIDFTATDSVCNGDRATAKYMRVY